MSRRSAPKCSVIIPLYNAAQYLGEALESVLAQQHIDVSQVEVIVFNDASTDDSLTIAKQYESQLTTRCYRYIVLSSSSETASGCGSARNRCISEAKSDNFIFLDADDIMKPTRLAQTLPLLETHGIVGGDFERVPIGSTPRYESFHRRVTNDDIKSLIYAFRDSMLAMPTVSCTRAAYTRTGGFEEGVGVPEDLHFMYRAIEKNVKMVKINKIVTRYRYHHTMTSLSLHRDLLMKVRVEAFERLIIEKREEWQAFSIWGAGRDGKQFYKHLSSSAKAKVKQWGDIDKNKIGRQLRGKPVVHWSHLQAPVVICVALDRDGELERNISESRFIPGRHYFHLV